MDKMTLLSLYYSTFNLMLYLKVNKNKIVKQNIENEKMRLFDFK